MYSRTIHRCNKVKDIYKVRHQIAELKAALLRDTDAVSLSAPQIGWDARVFVFGDEVIINPRILKVKGPMKTSRESCSSLKELGYVKVSRYDYIHLEWSTVNKKRISREFRGGLARIMQHELDHLNGIMISDHKWPSKM